jgi:signal transduction histidine kinase
MRTPGVLSRRPVRLRLTLLYSGLFLLAGAALLGVTYVLVADTLGTTVPQNKIVSITQASGSIANCKAWATTPMQAETCREQAIAGTRGIADAAVRNQRDTALSHLLNVSVAGLVLTAGLSALLGWVVAGRVLRPVHAITAAARRASEENLGERIDLTGPEDELKELADTFDAMLARLDAAFASQRRFVANASHELRTPLTVMRTAIDVTLAKKERTPVQLEAMAAEVRQATGQAERLVEALLTLARSDRGIGPRSALDLSVLAEDAIDAAAPRIRAGSLRVTAELEPGPAVGDPVLVERLVCNLIDNAVRHNTPGGWLEVTSGSRDGLAFLTVANSGPVIGEREVSALFEPFYRRCQHGGPDAPEGSGLGLSIAASVVKAHHGEISATPLPAGGLAVTCLLLRTGGAGAAGAALLRCNVVGDGAQQVGDRLGFLRLRVLAPPVGVRDPVEHLHEVLDDRDHLIGLFPRVLGSGSRDVGRRLEEAHLERLRALAPFHDAELDALSLGQGGRPGRQRRRMHEDLAPVIAGEEAEPLFGVIPLDLAGRHEQDLTSIETDTRHADDRRPDVMAPSRLAVRRG